MLTNRFKKISIADWITISRLIAVPVVIITTLTGLKIITGCVIAVALSTDLIDGFVMRYSKLKSKHGAMLDSIADASIFMTSGFSVIWFFRGFVVDHLWQVSIVFAIYLFQISLALIRYGQITTFHKYSAKIAAFPVGIFIVTCFFFEPVEWLFYIIWAIGLLVEAEEIALILMLPKPRENVKGIYWVLKEERERKEKGM